MGRKPVSLATFAGVAAFAAALACGVALPASVAMAQAPAVAPANGQMLVEADRLIYDNDSNSVTAAGNVRIDYDGRRIVANRVVYDRARSRLMAYGNVQIVEADGTVTFGDEVDISDDFREGFVNALRVETTDKTYFASESATRADGNVTTFNSGVYTACEPCEEEPDKAPIWRLKSRTIIWDGKAKTIRFIRPRLELFGFPIAAFPALTVPDHTVKRKSGFLFPTFKGGSGTGFGVGVPYYLVFSPSMDLTTTVTGFTRQGFLAEAEFRKRFNNGEMSVTAAGIWQLNPGSMSTPVDRSVTGRGMIGTKGRFQINPRWTFGWDVMAQTDKNFASTYTINGYRDYYRRDEIYLTGLNDRNYFDLRFMRFQVQEGVLDSSAFARNPIQPWVLPSFDYSITPDTPIAGGELNIDVNVQGIHRGTLAARDAVPDPVFSPDRNIDGLQGQSGRITAEAEWKRQIIAPGGLLVTPILHARADAIGTNFSAASVAELNRKNFGGAPVAVDVRSAYYRTMATAGLDVRWPILFSTASSSHVLEPVAQIFARPNEPFAGTVGIPNEDAQSLVFDATSLFERDKFSGYDRIEGGVRANLGLRYTANFGEKWRASAVVGQSFHLAGVNSFAQPDLVNAGAYSGLESARSDYVGQVNLGYGRVNFSAGARLDEQTLELRRGDVGVAGSAGPVSASVRYSYIQAQPLYGFANDRQEVTVAAATRVGEYWRVFGSGTYDFPSSTVLRNAVGFTYDDECFTFTFTASQSRTVNPTTGTVSAPSRSFGVRFSLRTLGDFGTTSGI